MSELGPKARQLLDLARDADEPGPSDERRIRRSLARRLALGGALTAAGLGAARPAVGAAWIAVAGKTVIGLGVGTALWGAWQTYQFVAAPGPTPAAARVVASAPARGAVGEGRPPPASADRAEEKKEPSAPLASRSSARRGPPGSTPVTRAAVPPLEAHDREAAASSPDALREETASLREVQSALRSGSPERALELLGDQDARFSAGTMAQERAAARVLALCELGRQVEARQIAQEFEAKWPRSPLLARVRGACSDREPLGR